MGSAINLHKFSAGKLKAISKISNHSFKFWVKSDIFTIIYNRICWKSILVNWLYCIKWDISKLDMRLTGMIRRNSIFLTGLTTPASLIQMKRCVSWNAANLPGWKDFNHCLVGWVSQEKKCSCETSNWDETCLVELMWATLKSALIVIVWKTILAQYESYTSVIWKSQASSAHTLRITFL